MVSGLVVVFGVVMLPLYLVLAGWFLGEPRHPKHAAMGVFFLGGIAIGAIVGLWMMDLALSVIMGL
ncbi:MAG: hypothetical protein V5A62_19530 [Haloarculaceae archaeon]